MCVIASRVYKCGCEVIDRPVFCPESRDRAVCEVVETVKKHFSQKCAPCLKLLTQSWKSAAADAARRPVAPATAVKSNPALLAALPVGGSNKRKAAPEPEQERPAKKAKKEAEAEGKREQVPEQKVVESKKQKKLEYQRQYRQKQALQKRREQEQVVAKAMALVAEAKALAQRAGAEAAALIRARAEAQAQIDGELEAEFDAAFEGEELFGEEPALTPAPAAAPAPTPLEEEPRNWCQSCGWTKEAVFPVASKEKWCAPCRAKWLEHSAAKTQRMCGFWSDQVDKDGSVSEMCGVCDFCMDAQLTEEMTREKEREKEREKWMWKEKGEELKRDTKRYMDEVLCPRCRSEVMEAMRKANRIEEGLFVLFEWPLYCEQCSAKRRLFGIGSENEDEDESDFEWESDRDSSSSGTDSSLASPTLLELRGDTLIYSIPVADLVPCHGYYYKIPWLQAHSTPQPGHCCADCFALESTVDGVATLVKAQDMFEAGYWSQAE